MRLTLCILLLSVALPIKAQFCDKAYRITPQNYLLKYYGIHQDIKRMVKTEGLDVLSVLAGKSEVNELSEICLHNRFLFTDFILYFDLEKRYARYSTLGFSAFEKRLMSMRDSLYTAWLSQIKIGQETGYHEWETHDVKGLSLREFQNLGSQKFSIMERIIKRVTIQPSNRNQARKMVNQYLDARTPFSAIMSANCFDLVSHEEGRNAIHQLYSNLLNPGMSKNLWDLTLESAVGDTNLALQLLSSVSAQRMYIIRDYKVWMEQNLDSNTYAQYMEAFKVASAIYFKIETDANSRQIGWNYPFNAKGKSPKSYHFYTTAMLAYQLAKAGFDQEKCIKESTRPGKKYKRAILIPGLVHNFWLRTKLKSSTVGDYRQVIKEQAMGARWGYGLAQS